MVQNAYQCYAGMSWKSKSSGKESRIYLVCARDPTWMVLVNSPTSKQSEKFHAIRLSDAVICRSYNGTQVKHTLRTRTTTENEYMHYKSWILLYHFTG